MSQGDTVAGSTRVPAANGDPFETYDFGEAERLIFFRAPYKDNQRFVRTARGSLYETRHWLRRGFKRGLVSQE